MGDALDLYLTVEAHRLPAFYELLATGFRVPAAAGSGIREVLISRVGLDRKYLEENVQTVFLNGRAVDDFDGTKVSTGDVLALSSAMPGLVGAVFRRQSPLATMRGVGLEGLNLTENKASDGWITLKLFNRVASDLGPHFLTDGIRIEAGQLARFLQFHTDLRYERVQINGNASDAREMAGMLDSASGVRLRVKSA